MLSTLQIWSLSLFISNVFSQVLYYVISLTVDIKVEELVIYTLTFLPRNRIWVLKFYLIYTFPHHSWRACSPLLLLFQSHPATYRILVLQPGIKPRSLQWKHLVWTMTRQSPQRNFLETLQRLILNIAQFGGIGFLWASWFSLTSLEQSLSPPSPGNYTKLYSHNKILYSWFYPKFWNR